MKTFFKIKVYILTDSNGEWWEDLGKDGSLRGFVPGTSNFNYAKKFKTAESALVCAKNKQFKKFKVVRLDPPVKPSITWDETIIHEIA